MSSQPTLDTKIPTNMADAVETSLQDLAERHGDLDAWLEKELGYKKGQIGKYLAAEQVDAVALALDNVQKEAAFIIGDQTGIGKGRVVASALRYAMRKGLVPIFVTEKPNLYGDIIRDLNDIGVPEMLGRDIKPFLTNAGEAIPLDDEAVAWYDESQRAKAEGQPSPPKRGKFLRASGGDLHKRQMAALQQDGTGKDFDIIFTTYDQMNTVKGQTTDRRRLVDGLAGRAFIVLDESHNAGGTEASERGPKNAPESRSDFLKKVTSKAKAVMFSSATYAKRPGVMALYARTDMGKAVERPEMLGELIAKGGVPMQQVVAAMLAKAGQYIRRERSFDGVSYDVEPVTVDTKAYEAVSSSLSAIARFDIELKKSETWEQIIEKLKEQAEAAAMDSGTGEVSVNSTNFTSLMHNIVNQMLLAIKTDAVATRAIQALRDGEKPVITVANTMGAFLKSYAEDNDIKPGDAVGLSFQNVLRRYLDRTLRLTVKRPDQTKYHIQIPLSALPGYMQREFEAVARSITQIDTANLPISPIDWLRFRLGQAGYRVAEITGRKEILNYAGPDDATFAQRLDSEVSPAGRRVNIDKFNRGDIDVMILNRAGSTGLSLHASSKFKDQRRRRMIIAQAELNIDVHMQMLGRVHRTGQVIPPAFVQAYADVPAEARPAAVLAKKMASLNANTTASRKSAFSADDGVDFLNDYGDQVAREFLTENPEFNELLDVSLDPEKETARELTGRLLLLPVADQRRAIDEITARYKALIENLDAMGENALEAKTVDLGAKTIGRQELKPAEGDSPFTQSVLLEEVEVKSVGKALPMPEIIEQAADSLGAGKVASDNAESALNELARVGERLRPGFAKKWLEDFDRMVADELKNTKSDDVRQQRREKHADNRARYNRILDLVLPGRRVMVRSKDGTPLQGIVLKVFRRGQTGVTGNPLALGAWTAEIAIADNAQRVTVPFSSMALPGDNVGEGERKVFVEGPDWAMGIKQTVEAFEKARQTGKEKRYIVTGNILAGFDQTSGQGQIVNYTDDQGNVKPGILMARSFDPAVFFRERAVRFKTAAQVIAFLKQLPAAEITSHDDVITVRGSDSGYEIELPASRQTGGTYFLNPEVRKAARDQFTKIGSRMRYRTGNEREAQAVLDAMMQAGAVFQTTDNQEAAEAIINGGQGRPTTLSSRKQAGLSEDDLLNQMLSMYLNPRAAVAGFNQVNVFANRYGNDKSNIAKNAATYVRQLGSAAGGEALVAFDGEGKVLSDGTGTKQNVGFSSKLVTAMESPNGWAIVHHNHPSSTSLSGPDLAHLAYPGLAAIWAHGNDKTSSYRASVPPIVRNSVSPDKLARLLFDSYNRVKNELYGVIADKVAAGVVSASDASHLIGHFINSALHDAGLIDYFSTYNPPLPAWLEKAYIQSQDIVVSSAKALLDVNPSIFAKALRSDRAAVAVRHIGDMGIPSPYAAGPSGDGVSPQADDAGRAADDYQEEDRGDSQLRLFKVKPVVETETPAVDPEANPYRFILSKKQSAQITAELHAVFNRLTGSHSRALSVIPDDKSWVARFGNSSDGEFDIMSTIISVALQGEKNPFSTLRHEIIHALRQAGVFTAREWAVLSKLAREQWMDQFQIRERYAHYNEYDLTKQQIEELMIEEAIAEAFSFYWRRPGAEDVVGRIVQKVRDLLDAIRYVFRQHGFTTAEQIFGSVESGRIAARARNSGQGRGFLDGGTVQSRRQDVTQTEAFKRWFGKSKVVDAQGRPLVVYHGTDADFVAFDKDKIKSRHRLSFGYHFTTRPSEAAMYATDDYGKKVRSGGNVMPVYVRLENPLIVDTEYAAASMEADLNRGPIFDKIREARLAGNPYDGVIIRRDRGDEWDGWNVIAFRPEQIKSATGNNGNFDPAKPSTLQSRRPGPTAAPADDGGRGGFTAPPSAEDDAMLEFAGNINLNYIDSPEAVKDVLRDAAEQAEGFMRARRGVVSHDQTRQLAEESGMSLNKLLKRKRGEAWNAHDIYAARAMLIKSADLVKQAAARARNTTSDVDRAYFMRVLTRHAAIQEQIAGMTSEAGRALNQFKMLVGADYIRGVSEMLSEKSAKGKMGPEAIEEMARMIDGLDTPTQIGRMTRQMFRPGFLDMIREFYINSLLSGPTTQTVNFMSNILTALNQIPESYVAEQIGKFRSGPKVERGETMARMIGLLEGSREGVTLALKTLQTGEPQTPESQFDQPMQKAIPGTVGEVVRIPSRLMMTADEFFKAVNYRAELNAIAVRIAMREGHTGQDLAIRIADLRDNPSEAMVHKAAQAAKYQTFQNKLGPKGQTLMRFRESWHLWFILPFLRTPINILKYAAERSPLGPLLMREVRDALSGKRGAVARDVQISRIMLGTVVLTGMAAFVLGGMATGGGDEEQKEKNVARATGWQPYSIKIGDTYYSYLRFDPFSLHLGIVADMIEFKGKMDEGEYDQLGWMVLSSIVSNITDKTWLKGATEFTSMLQDPKASMANYVSHLASGFVPNLFAQIARFNDPYFRDARSLMDKIKERVPGWRETLPYRIDVFGEKIKSEGNLGPDLFSPIWISTQKDNPVARAMVEADYFPGPPRRHMNGHDLTPEQYAIYSEIAGRKAVERLTKIVTSPNWAARPQEMKEKIIKKHYDEAREFGRENLKRAFPELRKPGEQ